MAEQMGRCPAGDCWYTLPLDAAGLIPAHSASGVLESCDGGGKSPKTPDRLILRGQAANEDVQIEAAGRRGVVSDRFHLTVTPDDQLDAGFYEALAVLDRQSLGRLLHWLQTGEALPRDDARIPRVFGGL